MQSHPNEPASAVRRWQDIPGWFAWRDAQEEAVDHFPEGSTFIEVGNYLGRSLCSLAEVVVDSGKHFTVLGVDTCRGSGPEGLRGIDAHGAAASEGGGTFAGILHRNLIACGFADKVLLVVGDSESSANLFADASLTWVHLDARHDYDSVAADITAWRPKVMPGGWLSGDDYIPGTWPGVVAAVNQLLPQAEPWSTFQWRWVNE
ncbi:hypothetical protein GCM10009764_86320 [Nocardia ninae]|uniref:Methyltransferase n=2 Tax=Nocardia ninae TaxID=356145 RepID=A0A511MT20_9NOCA|nr:hypothetical protein NN4_82530 [Nocardia ninae NBRC 108245]